MVYFPHETVAKSVITKFCQTLPKFNLSSLSAVHQNSSMTLKQYSYQEDLIADDGCSASARVVRIRRRGGKIVQGCDCYMYSVNLRNLQRFTIYDGI